MERLVEYVARSLVTRPDQVAVRRIEGDYTCIIEVEVAPEDKGKIIGREGRTAQALRALLTAGARTGGKKIVLEILE